jgi:hypothetical protein
MTNIFLSHTIRLPYLNTDALISDLRESPGADPNTVDFMVSYLFRQSTHINNLTNRR